jgi:asparagine synthase (glutamine-hydrolysing)
MCGFTGIVGPPGSGAEGELGDLLSEMAGTIAHRGPDDEVVETFAGGGLAFRRLSIIDLEGGRQPFLKDDGRLITCTNGELYNFAEVRRVLEADGERFETRSDCEVVPGLWRRYGSGLAEHLIGMFAFCVIDRRGPRTRVCLGRDRLGIKPLYWALVDGCLIFGSEAKALLASRRLQRDLRPEALLDYLVQGYVGGEASAWAGVHRLPPGTTLEWTEGDAEPRLRRYWDLPLELREDPETPEEILEWVDRVVADRLVADVPLGAFLSGGIDSNAVVDSMVRTRGAGVEACSVGFRERSHDELPIARATAQRLGLVHHTEILEADPVQAGEELPWLYDEPHADPSNLPTLLVSRMAREHVTVALSGDGGDETFAGYRRYVHDRAENRLRRAIGGPGRRLAAAAGAVYPKLDRAPRIFRGKTFLTNLGDDPARAYFRSVCQSDRAAALELLNPDVARHLSDHDPFHAFEEHYRRPQTDDPLYRAQYADFHTYLPDQILAKVDRASMGVSLEVRVPLLDHRFVERFAPLRADRKIQGNRGKHAFREALRRRLPAEILDGSKRGFDTPLAAWFRGPLAEAAREAVESLPAEWFRRDVLRRRLTEHTSGSRDHGRLLWTLWTLHRWRERHAVRGLA